MAGTKPTRDEVWEVEITLSRVSRKLYKRKIVCSLPKLVDICSISSSDKSVICAQFAAAKCSARAARDARRVS